MNNTTKPPKIYKRYKYPNGKTLELTKEEFDRVVDVFRLLLNAKREREGKVVEEGFYKTYRYPDGRILQLTKEEFDRVVNLFRMLHEEDQRLNGK